MHFASGEDFNHLKGSYSTSHLLNGEKRGVVLHLNHTNRLEAFNFTYDDSETKKQILVQPQTQHLSLTSESKMGDVYFNNVTRHIEIKFDGQNEDSNRFKLEEDKCISWADCNPPDEKEDEEIETEPRYWSNPNHWNTERLKNNSTVPVEGDEVFIDPSWNMIYDLEDSPVFKNILISGRLTVPNDEKERILRSYLIFNRKGELYVGSENKPYIGKMTFELHGERKDKDIFFHDKAFEGGNKVIANTGKLLFYGKPVDVKVTRLSKLANAGSNTITITDTPSDWKAGDQLGIAPSGRDYGQRDTVTIQSVSGNSITLVENLKYDHYGAADIDPNESGTVDIRAEVVHLTRNIRVVGTNKDKWGGHLVTAHNEDVTFLNGKLDRKTRKGSAIIDHVEFYN